MRKLTDHLYTGDSKDAEHADLKSHGITAILNVAHDLQGRRGWTDGVVYAQCGLIDGPGNRPAIYHAACLMLASLIADGKTVLVCCHKGGRALAVALFYLNLTDRRGWEGWLNFLREREDVADPHPAHKWAFDRVNWRLLSAGLE